MLADIRGTMEGRTFENSRGGPRVAGGRVKTGRASEFDRARAANAPRTCRARLDPRFRRVYPSKKWSRARRGARPRRRPLAGRHFRGYHLGELTVRGHRRKLGHGLRRRAGKGASSACSGASRARCGCIATCLLGAERRWKISSSEPSQAEQLAAQIALHHQSRRRPARWGPRYEAASRTPSAAAPAEATPARNVLLHERGPRRHHPASSASCGPPVWPRRNARNVNN